MPDDLVVDFVFVPNGAPFPHDWVRRHPDYISLPARFIGTPAQMQRFMGRRAAPSRDVFQKAEIQSAWEKAAEAVVPSEPVRMSEPLPWMEMVGSTSLRP